MLTTEDSKAINKTRSQIMTTIMRHNLHPHNAIAVLEIVKATIIEELSKIEVTTDEDKT